MNNIELKSLNLSELNLPECKNVIGGFFPIVILGIKIGADLVAAAFLTGVGVGAAVAQGQKSKN